MIVVCKVSIHRENQAPLNLLCQVEAVVSKDFADLVFRSMGPMSAWRGAEVTTIVGEGELAGKPKMTKGPAGLRMRLVSEFERVKPLLEKAEREKAEQEEHDAAYVLLQSKALLKPKSAASFLSTLSTEEIKVIKEAMEGGLVYFMKALEEYRASQKTAATI